MTEMACWRLETLTQPGYAITDADYQEDVLPLPSLEGHDLIWNSGTEFLVEVSGQKLKSYQIWVFVVYLQ